MIDSQNLLKCANRLRSAEFEPFVAWLKSERVSTLELLSTAPETVLPKLQGEAQRLKKIIDLIETAQAMLEKTQQTITPRQT